MCILSCSKPTNSIVQEYDNHMFNAFNGYYTAYQLDSICTTDSIEHNLNQWYIIYLKDYETKENISQYLYIKSTGQNESIYRLQIINDSIYKITKRITK